MDQHQNQKPKPKPISMTAETEKAIFLTRLVASLVGRVPYLTSMGNKKLANQLVERLKDTAGKCKVNEYGQKWIDHMADLADVLADALVQAKNIEGVLLVGQFLQAAMAGEVLIHKDDNTSHVRWRSHRTPWPEPQAGLCLIAKNEDDDPILFVAVGNPIRWWNVRHSAQDHYDKWGLLGLDNEPED